MSKHVFDWQRLRHQPVTVKPRIVVNDRTFKVEYFGRIVQEHVAAGYPTFEQAIEYANKVAQRNPGMVEAINTEREAARQRRIEFRQAVKHGFPVAA